MKQNSVLECIHRNRQWDIGFEIDQNEQDLVRIDSHSQIWTWHWKASYISMMLEQSTESFNQDKVLWFGIERNWEIKDSNHFEIERVKIFHTLYFDMKDDSFDRFISFLLFLFFESHLYNEGVRIIISSKHNLNWVYLQVIDWLQDSTVVAVCIIFNSYQNIKIVLICIVIRKPIHFSFQQWLGLFCILNRSVSSIHC